MNYLKLRKLLCIALLGATSIFGIQSHAVLSLQRHVAIKHHVAINPLYAPPILTSSVSGPIKTALEDVLAKTEARLDKRNIGFKKKLPLHITFFYLTQLPSQQELATIEKIVKEGMLVLKNQDISFTVVPELDLMGKATTFVVVRLQPSQGAINFFKHVRTELLKAGIAHVDYPKFEPHISLGKITTPGITQQELAQVVQKGTDDLEKIPAVQLPFTVSSCILVQNLNKPPVVSFEFQSTRPVPVVAQNFTNRKQAAAVTKAVQKVAPRVIAPKAKVAAKNAPKRPVVKQQPKAAQKVAPRVIAPKAKVVVKNAPKRPLAKQQPKVQPKAVQKVQPKLAQKVAPRVIAPRAKVVAKNAPKRPAVKQQPKMVKKPLKR